ncbi:hypothetical protein T492DRAFT_179411 [Pavlovales sp. CCMP2436]|nr:hypothetical protein T492DRAFT_179411 [Pavlovales sp. CCMP2436]
MQMPPSRPHWRSKPLSYMGHVLGHESEGSLLHLLKVVTSPHIFHALFDNVFFDGWPSFICSLFCICIL